MSDRPNVVPFPVGDMLGLRGRVLSIGWEVPPDITEQEWWTAGAILSKVEAGHSWVLGDWWLGHKPGWGNRAAIAQSPAWRAAGMPGYSMCKAAGTVSSVFETANRLAVLEWKHHALVASLAGSDDPADKAEAADLLDWCMEPLDRGEEVRSTDELVKEIARRRQSYRLANLDLPPGQYPILLVDPPWRYEHAPAGGANRAIENHYPTMSLDEMRAMAPQIPAFEHANLYCWTTAPKLAESLTLIDAWGFEYRTHLMWVKDRIGMGYHARSQHEVVLICKRGQLPPPPPELRESSVFFAERGEHSRKPVELYEMIERWYPTLPKVELFARNERDGWTGWGNQLPIADAAE